MQGRILASYETKAIMKIHTIHQLRPIPDSLQKLPDEAVLELFNDAPWPDFIHALRTGALNGKKMHYTHRQHPLVDIMRPHDALMTWYDLAEWEKGTHTPQDHAVADAYAKALGLSKKWQNKYHEKLETHRASLPEQTTYQTILHNEIRLVQMLTEQQGISYSELEDTIGVANLRGYAGQHLYSDKTLSKIADLLLPDDPEMRKWTGTLSGAARKHLKTESMYSKLPKTRDGKCMRGEAHISYEDTLKLAETLNIAPDAQEDFAQFVWERRKNYVFDKHNVADLEEAAQKDFATFLGVYCDLAGVSGADVGRGIGVDKAAVSFWLCNPDRLPTSNNAIALADYFESLDEKMHSSRKIFDRPLLEQCIATQFEKRCGDSAQCASRWRNYLNTLPSHSTGTHDR
jgi:hypothetical protein